MRYESNIWECCGLMRQLRSNRFKLKRFQQQNRILLSKKKKYNNDLNKTIQNKIQLKRKNLSVARTTLGSQTATGWSPPCWHWQIAKPDAEKQANKNSESFGLFIFFSVSFFFVFFFIFFLLLTRPFDSLSFWGSNLICSSQKPFCCFFVWNHSN